MTQWFDNAWPSWATLFAHLSDDVGANKMSLLESTVSPLESARADRLAAVERRRAVTRSVPLIDPDLN